MVHGVVLTGRLILLAHYPLWRGGRVFALTANIGTKREENCGAWQKVWHGVLISGQSLWSFLYYIRRGYLVAWVKLCFSAGNKCLEAFTFETAKTKGLCSDVEWTRRTLCKDVVWADALLGDEDVRGADSDVVCVSDGSCSWLYSAWATVGVANSGVANSRGTIQCTVAECMFRLIHKSMVSWF